MASFKFVVLDPVGLHARPATVLVSAAGKCKSDITLNYNGKSVNAKSIMGVMGMGVPTKAEVEVVVEGEDAADAVESIKKTLIDEKVTDKID